jgi:hypothetical protein
LSQTQPSLAYNRSQILFNSLMSEEKDKKAFFADFH